MHPTVEDIFNSINYSKRPPKFTTNQLGIQFLDCRICQELERSGRNKDVYEGHYGNYPTHCPRWSELNLFEREKIARAAGYCPQCMHLKVVLKSNAQANRHMSTECTVKFNRKNKYTCLHKECLLHSWICKAHKDENQPLFDAHMAEIASKQQKLQFCSSYVRMNIPRPRSPMDRRVEFRPNPVKVKPEERIGWILSGSMAPRTNQSPRTEERQANQASATLEEVNLSHSELMTTLRKHTPAGDTLVTKMKEPPLFMFSTIPGKNSPVQVFYDGGNSHLLFKRGTPKNLWGCVMRSGPHQLGAVGATTLMGGDSWACQPMLTNGKREVWIGIEVDQITTDFPMVDLREATNEIKASKPNDPELQRLVVPEFVGGEVHVLLGIQYIAHYPRKVHSLDCGLGIYELRLTSDGPATATIAGPHHQATLI